MIKDVCFTAEWLAHFKRQNDHRRIDPIILEKMIYALHLLERLKATGLDFIFKGGTSLVLLLHESHRFSIDIDIICKEDQKNLEERLNRVVDRSRFVRWHLDEHRSYQPGVPKAHYVFSFTSNLRGSGTIVLDVLIEDSVYPALVEVPIKTKWIETENDVLVTVPTVDAITGDKLTAFAPNTIGIPYFRGKDNQSFSMEIIKQLFDLGKLFEEITDVEMVARSFMAFAEQEISYRKSVNPRQTLSPEQVLKDIIDTCGIIAKKGVGPNDEQQKFAELQKGIKAFDFGYLMAGHFRLDDAVPVAARIAHLAAKLLVRDTSAIAYYRGQAIHDLNIEEPQWKALNKLKRQPNGSSFYYWHHTVKLLKQS